MYLFSGAAFITSTHGWSTPRQNSYTSIDGQTWTNITSGFIPPTRLYGRCIVDSQSRVYIFGSRETSTEVESNDVWQMVFNPSTNTQTWTQQTNAAQWYPRDSPGADSYTSSLLGTEILTLSGGYTLVAPYTFTPYYGGNNDVWASSDLGRSWSPVTLTAPFQVRDHGVLLSTPAGVLVVTTGGFGDYQTNDLWASLGTYR
jgi:hypothetical protein